MVTQQQKEHGQQMLKTTKEFHQSGIDFWLAQKLFASFEFKVFIEEQIQALEHHRARIELRYA